MTEDDVVIRPPMENDVEAIAGIIQEIEKYYGVTEIDSIELRRAQTARALFGQDPAELCRLA